MNILKNSLAMLLISLLLSGCGKIDEAVSETSLVSAENTTSAVTSTESSTSDSAETTEKTDTTTTVAETTALVTENTTEESTESSEDSENTGNSSTETKKVEIIIDPTMGQEDDPVVEQPSDNTPNYNQDIKDKLGIEVVLTGSNAEQAQQYYEACKAAYPSLPWYCGDNSAGIDVSPLRSEISIDVWSMSEEEVDTLIYERLGGRDYHDLTLEELYNLQDITERTAFGNEIYNYFMDLTSRDFVTGGYVGAW